VGGKKEGRKRRGWDRLRHVGEKGEAERRNIFAGTEMIKDVKTIRCDRTTR